MLEYTVTSLSVARFDVVQGKGRGEEDGYKKVEE
jgi:hypothetical protein